MLTHLSTKLKEKIRQATHGDSPYNYSVELILTNPNTGFKYTAKWVTGISLIRDYVNNYMDTMQISTHLTHQELRDVLANMQDLEATVKLTPKDVTTGQLLYDYDEIVWEMLVYMDEQPDLDKLTNVSAFADPDTNKPTTPAQANLVLPFTFNLISEKMHDIRQVGVNAILKDVTMKDVLNWVCKQFSFDKVEIIDPKNTITYEAIIIPPMQYIGTIFSYLQERYGVYDRGMGYYYQDDTMYIYPLYDTDNSTSPIKGTIQLVSMPPNQFEGMKVYYAQEDDDYIVGAAVRANVKALNTKGAENVATSYVSINADQVLDQFVKIDSSGKVERTENSVTTIQLGNSAGNTSSKMQNIKYTGQRTNIYAATSELAAYNGTLLTTGWLHCNPDILKPGHSFIYHFDGQEGEYRTQQGRLLRAVYSTSAVTSDKLAPDLVFNCMFDVFLDPDKSGDQQVQFSDTYDQS